MGFQKYLPLILFLIYYASGAGPTWSSPKKTSLAEQLEKIETEVSPATTSLPTILELDLRKRDEYSLPSHLCGWYGDYTSASATCGMIGASCVNYGSLRGCCKGAISDCASTAFFTTCIPFSSKDDNTAACNSKGIICCNTEYPECGTQLMSSRANRDKTYTILDCFSKGWGRTYFMQDYPPKIFTTESDSSTTTETSPLPTTTVPPDTPPKPTPVGAIVGGVIGGLAVIALLVIAIFFYLRKKPTDRPEVKQVNIPTIQPPNQPSPVSPPIYNTQASYTVWPSTSPEPISPVYNPPGGHYQVSPSTAEQYTGIPIGQEPNEVPATNPIGKGSNRAELS